MCSSTLAEWVDQSLVEHLGYPLSDWLLDQAEMGASLREIQTLLHDVTGHSVSHQTISNWLKRAGWEAQGKETA